MGLEKESALVTAWAMGSATELELVTEWVMVLEKESALVTEWVMGSATELGLVTGLETESASVTA